MMTTPRRPFSPLRLLPALAGIFIALTTAPLALEAQCVRQPDGTTHCEEGTGPGINGAPDVGISPDGAVVTQPSVPITIRMSDDNGLDPDSFRVYLGTPEVDITDRFGYTTSYDASGQGLYPFQAAAVGSINLPATGMVRLRVQACDREMDRQCGGYSAQFGLARPGVEVLPKGGTGTVTSGAPGTRTFTVRNRGLQPAALQLAATCRDGYGEPLPCSVSSAPLTLSPSQSASATVSYSGGVPGSDVIVKLTATQAGAPDVMDTGWFDVAVTGAAGGGTYPPPNFVATMNTGAVVNRGQCVTVATALRGAYECGDLRVVHGLPATATYNRPWAPALLYNSQHAHPVPTVYADVRLYHGTAAPERVDLTVTLAGGATHVAQFLGQDFKPETPRRVAVQWDGLGMATGIHKYYVQVTAHYPGQPLGSSVDSGYVAVVNRADGPYGAGWWVAGLEEIRTHGDGLMWIGGDGSTLVYERRGPGVLVAQPPDGPADTIFYTAASGSTPAGYHRGLGGAARVEFDAAGRHVRTVNGMGQATAFQHGAGRLDAVTAPVPPGGGAAPRWAFAYDVYAGVPRLKTITATTPGAPNRVVGLTHGGSDRRVTVITDPDGKFVRFGYPAGTYGRRITYQVNRRGTLVAYGYDAAGKLATSRLQMDAAANAARDVQTRFRAAESWGVAQAGATGAPSVPTSAVYTRIDGPRPDADVLDHTYLWLNPSGTIRRTRTPVGAETFLEYGDVRFPALATGVRLPSGMINRVWHDDQARLLTATELGPYRPGESSTTYYGGYDDACDRPQWIKGPATDTVHMVYDPITCSPRSQVQGQDEGRRVTFTHHPAGHPFAGLLESVTGPLDAQGRRAVERVEYDARGNLRATVSPLGFRTLHVRDALGRDSVVYTPMADSTARDETKLVQHGTRQTIFYDAVGRARETVSYGPAIDQYRAIPSNGTPVGPGLTPRDSLRVVTEYDDEGAPLLVTRTMAPNPAGLEPQVTRYAYDAAGRRTDEWTGGLIWTRHQYDQAGNDTATITPRQARISSRYDAAGRLLSRRVPEMRQAQTTGSCSFQAIDPYAPTCNGIFPVFPNDGTGYRVPEEITFYRYDLSGNLLYAENADAAVRRSYFPNGQVKTDSSYIRDFTGSVAFSQVFGIEYGYDQGRVTRVLHPGNLANGQFIDKFAYHPVTGALSLAEDRLGNLFSFTHDNTGALTGMTMPGGITDQMRYDLEGRLEWRRETSPAHPYEPLQEETYTHDARGKLVSVATAPSVGRGAGATFWQWYSGLGNLVMTHWGNQNDAQWQREGFTTDALGNAVERRTFATTSENAGLPSYYESSLDLSLGRVDRVSLRNVTSDVAYDETTNHYDHSGNLEAWYQGVSAQGSWNRLVDVRSYYGMDERLRAFQKYDIVPTGSQGRTSGLFEEYRYDPLGRRVAVRTRRPNSMCNQPQQCYTSTTFFVWAGDNLLWEIKNTDGAGAPPESRGVVSYFQAGGIDRPLVIWKNTVGSIVTHQNWRGQFSRGTWGEGTGRVGQSSDCTGTWPQQIECVPVPWPGWNTNAWHDDAAKPSTVGTDTYWLGSLSVGMRDASGQMYMRNRYYNPQTGQFTQPDPIGLAGGLNSYGFAAGDPVSYSDPYGLCPDKPLECPGIKQVVAVTTEWGEEATEAWADQSVNGSTRLSRGTATIMGHFSALWTPDTYEQTRNVLRTANEVGSEALGASSSPGRMQREVERGQAPRTVDRVDQGRGPYEKDHVEFLSGDALNRDGSWKHGGRSLSNAEQAWIRKHEWSLPNDN
ncbi:MAG TPA: RHS repeat-associated core domain-containing protein [Longimicrobium sp.]|nr:RHS repeat-associated core domain-containing protein [Longimicrobium sp.]